MAAIGAFLGHLFPVWLGFRGGKGVATFIGLLVGFKLWLALLAFCAIWLRMALATRYSSLPAFRQRCNARDHLVGPWGIAALLFLLLTAPLWITHRANIARLIGGTESKIGGGASA